MLIKSAQHSYVVASRSAPIRLQSYLAHIIHRSLMIETCTKTLTKMCPLSSVII